MRLREPIALAVGVGLEPFDFWDCGFEFCRWCGCLSLVFDVYCVGRGFCEGLITRSEQPYPMRVSNCV